MVRRRAKRDERTAAGRPGLRKGFLVTAGVLSVLLAGGAGVSIATIKYADRQITHFCYEHCRKGDPTAIPHVIRCATKVCNYLLLGSDSRRGFTKKQQSKYGTSSNVTGQRSDSILLVHLDLPKHKTTVLSIPRDLLVNIPGHGQNKINSAFDYGPDVLVQTVENLTGMQINHYVAINFVGFERLINVLGGVPICVDHPMIDQFSGLHLTHAGCYQMYGAQALAFVRSRHVQGDLIPDFSRISRQQVFFRAVLSKVISAGSLTHFLSIINAVKHNLVVDQGLNLYNLQDLAHKLADLGQRGVDFRVVPAVPLIQGGIDYLQLAEPSAGRLFKYMKEGRPLGNLGKELLSTQKSPATVAVQVYDANSGGKAAKVAAYLSRAGFDVLPIAPMPAGIKKPGFIYYLPGAGQDRDVVRKFLLTMTPRRGDTFSKATVAVVIGPGYQGPGV